VTDEYKTSITLLQRVQNQQDEESWNEFIETYKRFLYSVIRRMNITAHDADDLVQDIFVKVWEHMPNFNYDSSKLFRNWLCTVTRNKVLAFIKSKQAYLRKMDTIKHEEITSYLSTINLPEIEEIAAEEWEVFISNQAMKNISGQFSGKALEVFDIILKGKSIEEVAEDMGLKENSVYRLKNRVKAALMSEIASLRHELE